jgi:PAS domain S-box-containing protein
LNEEELNEIHKLVESLASGNMDARGNQHGKNKQFDSIIGHINQIAESKQLREKQMRDTEQRINEILKVIVAFSNLNFSKTVEIGNEGNIVDALASGINMLGEEMNESTISRDYFESIVDNLFDLVTVVNEEGYIFGINTSLINALGYEDNELKGEHMTKIIEEEVIFKHKSINKLIEKGSVYSVEKTCVKKNGDKFPVSFSASVMKGKDNTVQGIVCIMQDITEQKRVEAEIKSSLHEKEVLLKEIHHRVKNNLQIISSLLNLQSTYIKDPDALEKFKESQLRVKSMALIHEKLYGSKDLSKIDFKEYMESLISYLNSTYNVTSSKVKTHIDVDVKGRLFKIDTAIPCGLIINELISNSFKYAFPNDEEGNIYLKFYYLKSDKTGDHFRMIAEDNGVGMPKDIDFRETLTLGMQLINTLTDQLDGTIELDDSNGTKFTLDFAVK